MSVNENKVLIGCRIFQKLDGALLALLLGKLSLTSRMKYKSPGLVAVDEGIT